MSKEPTTSESSLKALIVDDEELARRGVRSRLKAIDNVMVVGECASGRAAVETIRSKRPDLVFLDVQMPGLDGFDVVESVGPEAMPVTIFVTAYDQHALRAFEAQALDYLLKPIDKERLREALRRAARRVCDRRESALARRLRALVEQIEGEAAPKAGEQHGSPPSIPKRFSVRSGGRIQFVDAADINYVEAAGDYVKLHTPQDTHLMRATMHEMEKDLGGEQFLRIHRSTIVRVASIRELRPYGKGAYLAVLENGTELKISRGYREEVLGQLDVS